MIKAISALNQMISGGGSAIKRPKTPEVLIHNMPKLSMSILE